MADTLPLSEAKRALLNSYLSGRGRRSSVPIVEPIGRRAVGDEDAPISLGQRQLWLLCDLMPDVPLYNECVTIHLPEALDVTAFERAFNDFVARHEAWRSTFPTVDGEPVQRIHPAPTYTLPVEDLRALPAEEREAESVLLATLDARIPLDVANGPLLKLRLIRLDDDHYRFYLTLHHLIFDGVALYQVFLPELRELYEAHRDGRMPELAEPTIQYRDYALWQAERLREGKYAPQIAYWKERLAGAPALLDLPGDFARPAAQSFRGGMIPFTLDADLTAALKALSAREGATLYMTLYAAFNVLLQRYSGQDEIVIGTATAGRSHRDLERLVGYTLNTLPLRADLGGDPTFRELLRRAREVVLGAQAHEEMPFEVLVRELAPARDLSRNAVFQVLLTLEPPLPVLPCGWTLTQMDVETRASKFDLSLEMDERPDGILGRFEYSSDLFTPETIRRTIGHWQTMLAAIVRDADAHISALPLLTEGEIDQLAEWNATEAAYPKDARLHELIEAQVARTPDAVAVECEGATLTYRELDERANALAARLRRLGVGPDTLVGIYVERSLEMLVGPLGILKAGGAYVPLDPSFPAERVAYMLGHSRAPAVVTQRRLATQLPASEARVVFLDALDDEDVSEVATEPPHKGVVPSATNLAYVIYTSGSTGVPKGVAIEHRAQVNLLTAFQGMLGVTERDRLLAVTTLSFDIVGLELYLPLLVGAQVVIATRATATDGDALAAAIEQGGITLLQATPSTWRMLLNAGWQGNAGLTALCGGEGLPLDLARQIAPRVGALWNDYGPTETTIWSSAVRVAPEAERITIGRPLANQSLHVLDVHQRQVPVGVPGELCIGGDGLARGYLLRDDLTAERFLPDPYAATLGARIYRTGDLARRLPNGEIELLGRSDFQVKVRGYRIELGEIETALATHPGVRQAVVMARDDASGEMRLVAYLALERSIASDDLRQHLKQRLPEYMIPVAYVALDALPLTPNGKVDRKALPAPEVGALVEAGEYTPPSLLVHYQLLAIWHDLLGVEPRGIRDNFFDLGGSSLLAARLVRRIEEACGRALPLATLFADPTIEGLANALLRQDAETPATPITAIQSGEAGRTPLFYLHGDWNGGAFYTFALARMLGAAQPFYAVNPMQWPERGPAPTLEQIAAWHLQAVRAEQPSGPYALSGFCNGGIIAYEMARQLRAQGEHVAALTLIDAASASRLTRILRRGIEMVSTPFRVSEERQLSAYLRIRHIYRKLRQWRRHPGEGMEHEGDDALELARIRTTPFWPPIAELRRHWILTWEWTLAGYRVPPTEEMMTLIWAEGAVDEASRSHGWDAVMAEPGVSRVVVAGDHITCRTSHLPRLAETIGATLPVAVEDEVAETVVPAGPSAS